MDIDFIATLHYRTTAEGGRKTPIHSGYFPQVKFSFSEKQIGGKQLFIGKDIVFPGELVDAKICLLIPSFFTHKLYEGMEFEIREADRTLGIGKITSIINEELRKS